MEEENKKTHVNYEKIGVYFAVLIGFLSCIFYIADIKERIARLETQVEYLQAQIQK